MRRWAFKLAMVVAAICLAGGLGTLLMDPTRLYSLEVATRFHFGGVTVANGRLAVVANSYEQWKTGVRWDSSFTFLNKVPPGIFMDDQRMGEAEFAGAFAGVRCYTAGASYRAFAMPAWYPALLFLVLPMLFCFRIGRRSRQPFHAQLCAQCRYDLRAHIAGAAGDKCPECGTPITLNAGAHE